ncbi:MAG: tRNA (adenosine(37)-N6)-threonylcarbamoyltransferase complex dimerization subunit type 1 TsaB [Elusimicrobia bacterium RIFCSPHIGHO2_02_FULL_57_9]|nr:MAG: tRNA (adenosine(37)-N6)-threonylcarbamoyltransferase complex dimerization subunit type 1 TsaB [Elusimicrobia bacterium RIFCSPHIGHO2_02_FULL_57_9]
MALTTGERIYELNRRSDRPHDETLLAGVDALCKRARVKPNGLDAIAAASGPGRFTGIRIGMAYAAVAAWRMKIPALAITRLEAAAYKIQQRLFCVALSGYREERQYQLFRRAGARLLSASAPCWVDAASWPKAKSAMEKTGVVVHEPEIFAADLLAPASDHLKRSRKPRFEPLYLKPAGYEKRRLGNV